MSDKLKQQISKLCSINSVNVSCKLSLYLTLFLVARPAALKLSNLYTILHHHSETHNTHYFSSTSFCTFLSSTHSLRYFIQFILCDICADEIMKAFSLIWTNSTELGFLIVFSLSLWKSLPFHLLNDSLKFFPTHTQVYILFNLTRCERRWVIEIQIQGSRFHLSLLCGRPSCEIGRHSFMPRLSPACEIETFYQNGHAELGDRSVRRRTELHRLEVSWDLNTNHNEVKIE